ncbi:MAG: hypothetical protein RLP44_01990 [Aggregatilineales bacterium]
MKPASLLRHMAWVVYITFYFMIRIPVLMSVIAMLASFGIGCLCAVAFGLEAGFFMTLGMLFLSSPVLGIGAVTAVIVAFATVILRHKLMHAPELYETRLVQFAGVVASFLALIVYPAVIDLALLDLTDTQSNIGRIVYAVIIFIIAMIATLSATDWYFKKILKDLTQGKNEN